MTTGNRKSWRVCMAIAALVTVPVTGQAALIHDIDIDMGTGGLVGSGQLVFNAEFGKGIGGLDAFNFAGVHRRATQVAFSLADVESLAWSISPDDWMLTIDLLARASDGSSLLLSNNPDTVRDCVRANGTGVADVSGLCLVIPGFVVASDALDGRVAFNPVESPVDPPAPVPEPAALLLMLLGLASFIGMRWNSGLAQTGSNVGA